MVNSIEAVIPNDSYTYKCLNQNKIQINPVSVEAYRKLVHKLEELKVNFHTYQIKQDKAYHVVLKHMHFSTDVSEIKSAIEDHGFQVRNVINMRQRISKTPLSMFLVDIEPNPANKNIFNIEYLLNAKITFEPPRKTTEIVQCKKCQNYGHTKTYCWHPFRCVKCGQEQDTKSCTKSRDVPPTCVLCNGNNPANYKGCNVYRELKNKTFPPLRSKSLRSSSKEKLNGSNLPSNNNSQPSSQKTSPHLAYAQAASTALDSPISTDNVNQDVNKTLQNFFDRFEKLMLQQSQQIGSLLNLLSTVLSKLK